MADSLPKQSSYVGIDSMIFNWTFRDAVDEKWEDDTKWKWVLARLLNRQLAEKKCSYIVPSVVLSESLAGLPEGEQQEFFNKMLSRCRIEQFDQWCGLKAAQIHQKHKGFIKELKLQRIVVKADLQIVATLIGKASCVYSHDSEFRKISNKVGLPAFDFPWPIPDWVDEQQLMDEARLKKESRPSWLASK